MIQHQYQFQVVLIPDIETGGYTVEVPALPGCFTEGDTEEEAMANAKEAISLWIDDAIAHNEPIPEDQPIIVAAVEV